MGNQLEIIKYVGDNNVLVAKSTVENFNTKTQLIVNESQEALFYKDGQALDLFPSGRYDLNSDNLPFFKKFFSKFFGGKTPFNCEVFFINKVSVLDVLWGTDTPITLEDPRYHIVVGVRANGQTGIKVIDSRKFVVKVVGQIPEFTIDSVKKTIKGILLSHVKVLISEEIIKKQVGILEIQTQLIALSQAIEQRVNAELEEYGLQVTNFHILSIAAGPNDLTRLTALKDRYLEEMTNIDIEAMKTVRMGEAMAASRKAQGYTYQDERKYDVLQEAAGNEGGVAGTMINAGVGLGVGVGVATQVGHLASDMANKTPTINPVQEQAPIDDPNKMPCCSCAKPIKLGAKFCPFCGTKQVPPQLFCSECGAKLEPGAAFCLECGAKVGQ